MSRTRPPTPPPPRPRGRPADPPAPEGVEADLWAYALLGKRVAARMARTKLGLKAAAAEQAGLDRVFKGRGAAYAAQAHNVFTRLTEADWARIGKARTREGKPVTRTHLQVLAQDADRDLIDRLLEGLETEGWTAMEIRDKARALKGDRPDRRGGRPRRSPRSLAEGIEWVVRDAEDWLGGHGPDAPGRMAWTERPIPGGADREAFLDKVVHAKERLRQMARSARALEGRLSVIEAKVREGGAAAD